MSAYFSIFTGIPFALLVVLSAIAACFAVGRSTLVVRSVFLYPSVWLSPIFYFSWICVAPSIGPDVVLALLFELLVLILSVSLLGKILERVQGADDAALVRYRRWLKTCLLAQLAISGYLLSLANFGIFSEGSRIEYISDSKLGLFITYLGIVVTAVAIPLCALVVSKTKRWTRDVILYLLLLMIMTVLSGSKGNGVLMLIGLICYLWLPRRADYFALLRVPLVIAAVFLVLTIIYVGAFISLQPDEMISLMFTRFFLSNDGRALAIDLSNVLNGESFSVFREGYRFVASLIGNPPVHVPLGQLLYQEAFMSDGLIGANTSATALLVMYGGELEKFFFFLGLCSFAVAIYWGALRSERFAIPRQALGLSLLFLLSQDFLAFQLVLIILAVCWCVTQAAIGVQRYSLGFVKF